TSLDVPVVKQTPQRCGQAALEMVFRYYGASAQAVREAERAYDPALRGSLVTDLASAARRVGFQATISTLTSDSLLALLVAGAPPIVLYQNGRPPFTVAHYGVVTGWNSAQGSITINDGRAKPRTIQVDDFVRRWQTAGSLALVIRPEQP
ncbi:MAG: cysteine peptidase family C39 domain-containing protein, partial [Candidatus Eisenbacteria bacterium]